MSFGFKVFAGWVLGFAGFTLDVFAANAIFGQPLSWLVFLSSSLMQILGFSFMIYIFERKIVYPKFKNFKPFWQKQFRNFTAWTSLDKFLLVFLILTILLRIGGSIWSITNIPTYDFDAWNNWNLRAKVIYTQNGIPLDKTESFYLAGGIGSYPLNDAILKVWLATAAGSFEDKYVNLTSVFYYLVLILVFYFSLPARTNRKIKLLGVYLLSSLPLLFLHAQIPYADLLFSLTLFLIVSSMFYFLAGSGNSFYYLSLIFLAFSVWTKNEGLSIIFPVMVFTSLILVIIKKVKLKDFFLAWFFSVLTVLPWLYFRIVNRLDFLSGDSSTFNVVFNSNFIGEVISSVFLRSHFNILWLVLTAFIIFKFKEIFKNLPLKYLTLTLLLLFFIYNGIIIFTDKALDLSAVARINMQLGPLAVLLLTFYFQKFFGKLNSYDKKS